MTDSRLISSLYRKYGVPQNLEKHMFRVASLAHIVIQNWIGSRVSAHEVILLCLFHDIAKPVRINFNKTNIFIKSPETLKSLRETQQIIIKRYGKEENQVRIKIAKEIGLSKKTIENLKNLEWKNIPNLLNNNQVEPLISIYADMHIGPFGFLTLTERISNLTHRVHVTKPGKLLLQGKKLEEFIQKYTKIDLAKINQSEIEQSTDSFIGYMILEQKVNISSK